MAPIDIQGRRYLGRLCVGRYGEGIEARQHVLEGGLVQGCVDNNTNYSRRARGGGRGLSMF